MTSIDVDSLVKAETLTVDEYGRVTLGKELAGRELKVIAYDPDED